MLESRKSGILLHPTSFPGSPGIGTLGEPAYRFLDWLAQAGQTLWQILPLGPTGYGDSPYSSFSTFAGNPLLVDLAILQNEGLLSDEDILPPDYISMDGPVDYGSVLWWKMPILKKAAQKFLSGKKDTEYTLFLSANEHWIHSFAIFMSIKNHFDQKAADEKQHGKLWYNWWPKNLASAEPNALQEWQKEHKDEIESICAIQYFFFRQWKALRQAAHAKGISIIGDIPIFVAADSADVWANQRLFQLNRDGSPQFVAGVPPDYFSTTGQLWGNPLYNWKEMAKDGYSWWIKRIRSTLALVDYIRIDHFRGFESYWAIPAGEKTAVKGSWKKGPGHDFFTAIRSAMGDVPIIAEDLGIITEAVGELRDTFALPGMKVLQFAFDPAEGKSGKLVNSFLPHMHTQNSVVYTGTHDNDTLQGWLHTALPEQLSMIRHYFGRNLTIDEMRIELIRSALMSVSNLAVIPLQDVFGIGNEGRMNMPSTTGQNWAWRMSDTHYDSAQAQWLRNLSFLYGRNIT